MAAGVPPPPLNSPSGSYYWLEWYTNLTNFLNGTNIPWSNINFGGSNLTDIVTRNHNDLNSIQGGNNTFRYHMLGAGSIASGGTVNSLPLGWLCSKPGTGHYTITHNQGVSTTDMIVAITPQTSAACYAVANVTSGNSFDVFTFNSAGTLTDEPFSFVCTTI